MQEMPEYKDTVSLIPYGLPQFLDFECCPNKVGRISMTFKEQLTTEKDGKEQLQLLELFKDKNEGYLLAPDGKSEYRDDDYYELRADRNLSPWLGKWIPVPFLRHSGNYKEDGSLEFRPGPTNWARAYLTRVPSEEDPDILNWRLVLAFDMQVEQPQGGKHAALSPDDVTARATCSLADNVQDNAWFIREGWVDGWLKSVWEEYFQEKAHQREKIRTADGEDANAQLGYYASYLLYLKVIQNIIGNINVRIANISGGQEKAADSQASEAIDVDLVLDIGNSRSTGMLVENQLGKTTDLNDSYRLQLRDLSNPERFYSKPFETRVEFSRADFGKQAFSKRSGRRSNAFTWVSPIRTGPEATRLASLSSNAEGASGMSSPKRYLWDEDETTNLWYFTRSKPSEREELVSTHPISRFLNNCGTPVSCVRDLKAADQKSQKDPYLAKLFNMTLANCRTQPDLPASQPRFSRSSMMMFLFMELIQQALVTINSPGQRYRRNFPDKPRRLKNIIFTIPPGMPFAEQRIYRRWAHAAVSVLWDALGWKEIFYSPLDPKNGKRSKEALISYDYRMNPEIRCSWDEATSTQLVYLYNEINRNYQGDAHLFFEIMGRVRQVPKEDGSERKEEKPTIRVATIDIGGGTTDLSITNYVLANDKSSTNRILPIQEFRDGFNMGGDDVLKNIVAELVCKALIDNLLAKGVPLNKADLAIREIFGKKSDNIRIQNLRIKFLRQICLPIAYQILRSYEKLPLQDVTSDIHITLSKILGSDDKNGMRYPMPLEGVVEFFNKTIEDRCGIDPDILSQEFTFRSADVDKTIRKSVSGILEGLGEVINMYDCDALLLTGRPSLWNAIIRQIFTMLPVAPDRIIPMHSYTIGPWYPFADITGRINDPKTTVVTGAILCTLAQNSIEGFAFNSNRLKMKNTARYIGELDTLGCLQREKVWFPNLNPDKSRGEDRYTKIINFSSPITIGFRQLEVPRWTTQRCWSLDFADEAARQDAEGKTPYKVKIRFKMTENGEDPDYNPDQDMDLQVKPDQPEIDREDPDTAIQMHKINDGQMELVSVRGKPLKISLRTLDKKEEDGSWMDTGILFN